MDLRKAKLQMRCISLWILPTFSLFLFNYFSSTILIVLSRLLLHNTCDNNYFKEKRADKRRFWEMNKGLYAYPERWLKQQSKGHREETCLKKKVYVDLYLSNGIYSLLRMSDFTIFFSNVSFILESNPFLSFLGGK